jgi:hypothetical protein
MSSHLASRLIAFVNNRKCPSQVDVFCLESQKKSLFSNSEKEMSNCGFSLLVCDFIKTVQKAVLGMFFS